MAAQRVMWRNKYIGTVENRVFTRSISGERGMLRQPRAWALQADNFKALKGKVDKIIIIDTDNGKKYSTTYEFFDEHKKVINRGFGEQYYLFLDDWVTTNGIQPALIK